MFKEEYQKIEAILNNIAKNGLLPAQYNSITSKVDKVTGNFCYNIVKVKNDTCYMQHVFADLSYHTSVGAWSIALEGLHNDVIWKNKIATRYATVNNVIFIFNHSKLENGRELVVYSDLITKKGYGSDDTYLLEGRNRGNVKSDDLYAVLAPEHLVPIVKKYFSNKQIISVKDCTKVIKQTPAMFYPELEEDVALIGPDYESAFKKFCELNPTIKEFGVHLTRLCEHQLERKQTLKVILLDNRTEELNYQKYDSYKGAFQLKRFKMWDLSESQTEQLYQNPQFTLIKDYTAKNTYYIIFHESHSALLYQIHNMHKTSHPEEEKKSTSLGLNPA